MIGSACWTLIFRRNALSKRCRLAGKDGEVSGHVVARQQLASALRLAPRRGVLCPFLQWRQPLAAPLRLAPPASQFDAVDPPRAPVAPSTPLPAPDDGAVDPRGRSPGGGVANPDTPAGDAPAGSAARRRHVGDRRRGGAARTTSGKSDTDACDPSCPPSRAASRGDSSGRKAVRSTATSPWVADPQTEGWVNSSKQRRVNSRER